MTSTIGRVLITGGAGFIGCHLSELYLKKGWEVYIIDDLSTGSLDNIQALRDDPNYEHRFHVTIDTMFNEEKLTELVGTCDIVFHLAAAVGVKYIIDHPLTSITTNINGTELVLKLAHKFKKRVLIASTSEVYGKQSHAPLVETDDITLGASSKSRWSYAGAKLIDEFLALAYHRTSKLPVVIVRFFNTVGPKQTGQYGMVIPNFVQQALREKPITVFGDGEQTRTFTHVDDVCQSLVRLIDCEQAFGEVVNIGGVDEISMNDLASKICELTGSPSPIQRIPYHEVYNEDFEDMPRRVPCTDKLQGLIGSTPNTGLEKILNDVIHYFRNLAP
jgi:UDP-glucose 4-epimerase